MDSSEITNRSSEGIASDLYTKKSLQVEQETPQSPLGKLTRSTSEISLALLQIPHTHASEIAAESDQRPPQVSNPSANATAVEVGKMSARVPCHKKAKEEAIQRLQDRGATVFNEAIVEYLADLIVLNQRAEKGGDLALNPLKAISQLRELEKRKPTGTDRMEEGVEKSRAEHRIFADNEMIIGIVVVAAETKLSSTVNDRMARIFAHYGQKGELGDFIVKVLESKYFPKSISGVLSGERRDRLAHSINGMYENMQAYGKGGVGREWLAGMITHIAHKFTEGQVSALRGSIERGLQSGDLPNAGQRGYANRAEDEAEDKGESLSFEGITPSIFDGFYRLVMGINRKS